MAPLNQSSILGHGCCTSPLSFTRHLAQFVRAVKQTVPLIIVVAVRSTVAAAIARRAAAGIVAACF